MSAVIGNPLLLPTEGYQISRSVRLRSSASAYFNRTPGSTTNTTTWTWSGWVKRGQSAQSKLFGAATGTSNTWYFMFSDNVTDALTFGYFNGTNAVQVTTTPVYRDYSAWYHVVLAVDTTQATASNRVKIYVNGVQVTSFATATYPTLNQTTWVNNNTAPHYIGATSTNTSSLWDGYLTEINFIDGQALTPSSFGETDAITGVWKPKKYSGTYGTNGFYLNFSDNSNNSSTTIGKDYSGNGNNWTPNNISVTSGVTYDSMLDVPTLWADGGNGRGNYAVWNPLSNGLGNAPSNANLRLSGVSGVTTRINSTIGVSSGKWYFEATLTTASDYNSIGIGQNNITNQYPGNDALSYAQTLERATSINNNVQPSYGTAFSSGDVFICAFDLDNNKLFFGRNGTWFGSSDPAAGTNPVYTLTAGTYNAIARPNPSGFGSGGVLDINFGQRPFAYTPPTGFKALNTGNLPEPTIKKGASYFDTTLYTGTGSTQTITNSAAMQPDLVWIKNRSNTGGFSHVLFDSVRGTPRRLSTNLTEAENVTGSFGQVSAFNSNGFTVATGTTSFGETGSNGDTFVGWQWKEGATQGFDIVTYTGNGTAGRTISHSLGVSPAMTIVKDRSNGTNGWPVWHRAYAGTQTLYLESTTGLLTRDRVTAVSSTTFTVGSHTEVNNNGNTYVAYLFSEVAGFSKFGSYTGNGSADGPFVYTGFRPRWIMLKRTDTTASWCVVDTSRSPANTSVNGGMQNVLFPNNSNAEDTGADMCDGLSNGFKLRQGAASFNASGGTYIYACFAENPFKLSLAR